MVARIDNEFNHMDYSKPPIATIEEEKEVS